MSTAPDLPKGKPPVVEGAKFVSWAEPLLYWLKVDDEERPEDTLEDVSSDREELEASAEASRRAYPNSIYEVVALYPGIALVAAPPKVKPLQWSESLVFGFTKRRGSGVMGEWIAFTVDGLTAEQVAAKEAEAQTAYEAHVRSFLEVSPMTNPTIPEHGLDVSDGYVLIKNGYFWRPNAAGYTSHLADAGIYSDEESRLRCANPDVTRERYVDALARRLPPADNAVAWRIDKHRDRAIIEAVHRIGQRIFTGQIGTDQEPTEVQALAEMILHATPSYAEGRVAGLREAAKVAAAFVDGRLYKPKFPACSYHAREISDAIEALIGAAL